MTEPYKTVTLPNMNKEEHKEWEIYAAKHEITMRDEPAELLRRLSVVFIQNYRNGINLNNC